MTVQITEATIRTKDNKEHTFVSDYKAGEKLLIIVNSDLVMVEKISKDRVHTARVWQLSDVKEFSYKPDQ